MIGVVAWLRRLGKEQGGNVTVLMAAGMAALFGFAATSVDAGRVYVDRQRLHDVADVAALAGAALLPDQAAAAAAAGAVAADNGVTAGLSITFPDSRTIAVEAEGTTNLLFTPVLDTLLREVGFHVASRISVSGVGAVWPRGAAGVSGGGGSGNGWDLVTGGAVPLATEMKAFAYGELVALKVNPGNGTGGNIHTLALGGSGADTYRQNLERGYAGVVRVGDRFYTEPGNMTGPTRQGVNWRIDLDPEATFDTVRPGSPRLVFVAVVDSSIGADGRTEVEVQGFAAFFLEGANGGEVTGRFIRWLTPGDSGGPDFGLVTLRFES